MVRLHVNPINPQKRHIESTAQVLREGGLIIYPTDTVYGLGCDLYNKKAVERIYQIKGMKKKKTLSFICPDLKDIARYAHVSTPAYKIMRRLLPGPYTFILPATREVPKILLENRKTIGIRVPDNTICHDLLDAFGGPIISTSAALPDQPYQNDPDDIEDHFQHFVDIFLDAGEGGLDPSTILDMNGDTFQVIREGKGYDSEVFRSL